MEMLIKTHPHINGQTNKLGNSSFFKICWKVKLPTLHLTFCPQLRNRKQDPCWREGLHQKPEHRRRRHRVLGLLRIHRPRRLLIQGGLHSRRKRIQTSPEKDRNPLLRQMGSEESQLKYHVTVTTHVNQYFN